MRDSFVGWEKSIAGLWTPSKRQKWPQTDRQRSRRLEEPPNGLSGFNRPFDDQSDLIVRLQTEAKLHVQKMIRDGAISLIWSAIMDIENSANPDLNRKVAIADWQQFGVVDVTVNERIEEVAETLSRVGVKPMRASCCQCNRGSRRILFDNG